MLLFLRETWELFWWAMFCPSRLQQRMNEWLPQKEKYGHRPDTSFFVILFFGNFRFISQYLLLLFIYNIPLILRLIERNQLLDWLQLPCVMLIAYTTGILFLPLGLVIPLLWLIVILNQPDSWLKGLIEAIKVLPTLPEIGIFFAVFGVFISFIVWLILQLLKLLKEELSLPHNVMALGGIISVMLGAWLATQNWLFLLLVSGMTGFFLFLARESIKNSDDAGFMAVEVQEVAFNVAFNVAFVVAVVVAVGVMVFMGGVMPFEMPFRPGYPMPFKMGVTVVFGVVSVVALGMAFVVAVGVARVVAFGVLFVVAFGVTQVVAFVVAGVAALSLTWFSVAVGLIAFALAPSKDNRVFISTTVILIALFAENLKLVSVLIIPVTLVSYYRIFPDYSFIFLGGYYTYPNSLLKFFRFSDSTIRRLPPQIAKILFQLPPYTSELLWIPLPNHAQLLVSEFRERPQQALRIFQYTQTFSLPGFKITLQNALPQIVADQLKQIQSIPELIFTANSDHPILPFLISPFYHLDSDSYTPTPETPLPKVERELSILLPRLQNIIQDIQSALENQNIPLRKRRLEQINNKLVRLQSQLSSLGLKDEAIKRWTPVLEHWQSIIQLEQNEQSKLSQGELINPFQYGNPLRFEQKNLFKGRQRFANEIVRRVLDRDRPTLVLHSPRRCGKTSFLYNFRRLLPSDFLPVFVDMQSSAITTSESDFCFGLVRAIHKDCKSQGVQLPNIPKRTDFQASPYTTLEDWLDEALAQIGERRILLSLDEFEKIGTAIKKGQITLRLFDQLRHLIQHYEQLGFLFSGVQTLEELGPNWSSYFISVVPIEMLYLEPNEAEELLLNPDPDFTLRYPIGIVKKVLELTNCHPYCLQLLGASMVNQANFNHTNLITAELLQASINDAFISGQPYFTNIWTEFTGTTPEEMVIGQELLLQVARTDILLPISTEIAEKVLTRLLRYHILHEINGGYDFEIPLLKQWVRERAVKS